MLKYIESNQESTKVKWENSIKWSGITNIKIKKVKIFFRTTQIKYIIFLNNKLLSEKIYILINYHIVKSYKHWFNLTLIK